MPAVPHRGVIVGGGFGGARAAQDLRGLALEITLLDRTNHHLFQPLLYQVATGVLSPGQIAPALRSLFRRRDDVRVLLAESTASTWRGVSSTHTPIVRRRSPTTRGSWRRARRTRTSAMTSGRTSRR